MKDYIIIILALLTYNVLHALMFTMFRSNKYEDVLAKKIAREVVKEMKGQPDDENT